MWRWPDDIHNFEDQEFPKAVLMKTIYIYSLAYFVQFVLGDSGHFE